MSKTFTEEELTGIVNNRLRRQELSINIGNFYLRAISGWQAIGLTEDERKAGEYMYRLFITPQPQPQPQQQPKPTNEPVNE